MGVRGDRAHCHRAFRASLFSATTLLVLNCLCEAARAQVQLPQLTVTAAKKRPPQPRRARPRVVTAPARTVTPPARIVTAPAPSVAPTTAPISAAEAKNNAFDQARSDLYTTVGTTSDTLTHETIQSLPQGSNAPAEKVLLQAPGVSQDSAASGLLHVRNDHANIQFRINGVMLPDGVTG
ncbi:MAG TPA: ligand-gated channel, partial [Xanthobacteraceae bacterium]